MELRVRTLGCLLAALLSACGGSSNSPCGACTSEQVCLGVTLADGGVVARCGKLAQAFDPCGPSIPAACANDSLECISFGGPTGACYQTCDPATPVCPTGLSCLTALPAPDAGICANPSTNGSCDPTQQIFCPTGQVCMGNGSCLKRCDPAIANDCPQLETCVTPSPFDPEISICTQPQPVGGSCSPAMNVYCDQGAFCVSLSDGGNGCLKDCSDGGSCPPTQACREITDPSMTIILGVCY
jgi:hypothetical protein